MAKSSKRMGSRTGNILSVKKVSNVFDPSFKNVLTFRGDSRTVRSTKNGVVICNQELISNPQTASNPANNAYITTALNPAAPTFPWASTIVPAYSYYRFRKLRLLFSSSQPTTAKGSYYLGLFRDVQDSLAWISTPGSQYLTYTEGSQVGPTYGSTIRKVGNTLKSDIMLDIDCAMLHTRTPWFMVAPTVSTSNANQAIPAWVGQAINPNGGPGSEFVGQIIADYEIELIHSCPPSYNINKSVLSDEAIPGTIYNEGPMLTDSFGAMSYQDFISRKNNTITCSPMELDDHSFVVPPNSPNLD